MPVRSLRRQGSRRSRGGAVLLMSKRGLNAAGTCASLLVSGGASLEMIGKLLGHAQIGTTQRYAHLIKSPLRGCVNAVGEILKPRFKVVAGCRLTADDRVPARPFASCLLRSSGEGWSNLARRAFQANSTQPTCHHLRPRAAVSPPQWLWGGSTHSRTSHYLQRSTGSVV